ncbi:MAG TPA: hypothetical protein VF526_16460 [Solirubrobacteraceae bacterium]
MTTATAAASTASAAAYRIGLSPQSMPAGGQKAIRATIHASGSAVGSVNLTPPEGYAVAAVKAPRGSKASVVRNLVRLRRLAIRPGRSKTVTLTVNAPCSSRSTATWNARAKASATFAGKPLSPRGSRKRLTTRTTARCRLEFSPQPGDVKVGDPITGTDFDAAAPGLKIVVIDGARRRSRSSGVRVAIKLAPGSSAGPLVGGETRSSVKGVVAFPGLTVGSPGSYQLSASGKRIPPTVSDSFEAQQDVVECSDNSSCTTSATKTGTFGSKDTPYSVRVDVTAPHNPNAEDDGGMLTTSFNSQRSLNCRGYGERSPDTAVFVGPNREKIVRFTVSQSLLAAHPGPLQACVGLPYNFLARLLTRFPVAEDSDGDGVNDQFVGQLNGCFEIILGLLITPPCISERGTDASGNAFITIRVPADDRDPRYRS